MGPRRAAREVCRRAFSRELVAASARAIRDRWRPSPEPDLGHGPSVDRTTGDRRRVRTVARRRTWPTLRRVLTVLDGGRPQKAMQNSSQQLAERSRQARHRWPAPVPPGPVLLVDDIVDSGWTLTVAGALLRSRGSGPVHPVRAGRGSGRDAATMIDFETLSPDAPAIVLLCSSSGRRETASGRPLGPVGADLADRCAGSRSRDPGSHRVGAPTTIESLARHRPRGGPSVIEASSRRARVGSPSNSIGSVARRLGRDGRRRRRIPGSCVDAWVPTRRPCCSGAGTQRLLDRGGIAIVGSRDADDDATAFTERLATAAARGATRSCRAARGGSM